jgi:class 3 adenylate cyclase/TM2 domain-containing membrane protein YozV
MESKKQRRLAAIMFTDIVGYSKIMESDEERGIRIRRRHREIFEDLTAKYDGELLQYFGDGTLSIFQSAAAAVECAVKLQTEFQLDPKVPLRIGIHTGDITFAADDAYGHGMNIAARIEPMCIPGGVYISGKVYEDIVNHPWLEGKSLGFFELKNINDALEIYAITNKGVNAPEFEFIKGEDKEYIPRETPVKEPDYTSSSNTPELISYRKRMRAAFLAFLLGVFGVHRFYLGQRGIGLAHIITAIIGIIAGVWFLIAIPAIIGFVDAVTFAAMSKPDFDLKYNTEKIRKSRFEKKSKTTRTKRSSKFVPKAKPDVAYSSPMTLEEKAQKALRIGEFDIAVDSYLELLDKDPTNPDLHYQLASSYSMKQDAKKGFFHLSKAVEMGFKGFQRIKNHYTLAFLRSRNDFKSFEENGYRLIKMLPSPQETLLDTERPLLLNKLEKIEELGELLYRGDISEEEFTIQKRELLED